MKSLYLPLLALTSALAMTSCKEREQVDITPPEIIAIALNNSAADTLYLLAGQTYTLEIEVEDNKLLESLKLNSSNNTVQPIPAVGAWFIDETFPLSGTSKSQDYLFTVPDSVASYQNLSIKLSDSNGYLDQKTIPIIVSNDLAPSITGTTVPMANSADLIQLAVGQNLEVSGEAFGIDGLATLKVMLWNTNNTIVAESVITITGNPMAFSGATFDNAQIGHYRVVIEAIDQSGQKTYWAKWVHVS